MYTVWSLLAKTLRTMEDHVPWIPAVLLLLVLSSYFLSSQLTSSISSIFLCLRTQTGNCCDGSMGPMLRHDRLLDLMFNQQDLFIRPFFNLTSYMYIWLNHSKTETLELTAAKQNWYMCSQWAQQCPCRSSRTALREPTESTDCTRTPSLSMDHP